MDHLDKVALVELEHIQQSLEQMLVMLVGVVVEIQEA